MHSLFRNTVSFRCVISTSYHTLVPHNVSLNQPTRFYSSSSSSNQVENLSVERVDNLVSVLKETRNGQERSIYLVGTAHVSKQSSLQVTDVINSVKPEEVMVELCPKRYEQIKKNLGAKLLLDPAVETPKNSNPQSIFQELFETLSKGMSLKAIVEMMLKRFYNVFKIMGITPGLEFYAAISAGEKLSSKLILGDQHVDKTMSNLGNNLMTILSEVFRNRDKVQISKDDSQMMEMVTKAIMQNNKEEFEKLVELLKNRERTSRTSKNLKIVSPTFFQTLLGDRDIILTRSLIDSKGSTLVAVVGVGHMDGIEHYWMNRKDLENDEANMKPLKRAENGIFNVNQLFGNLPLKGLPGFPGFPPFPPKKPQK